MRKGIRTVALKGAVALGVLACAFVCACSAAPKGPTTEGIVTTAPEKDRTAAFAEGALDYLNGKYDGDFDVLDVNLEGDDDPPPGGPPYALCAHEGLPDVPFKVNFAREGQGTALVPSNDDLFASVMRDAIDTHPIALPEKGNDLTSPEVREAVLDQLAAIESELSKVGLSAFEDMPYQELLYMPNIRDADDHGWPEVDMEGDSAFLRMQGGDVTYQTYARQEIEERASSIA